MLKRYLLTRLPGVTRDLYPAVTYRERCKTRASLGCDQSGSVALIFAFSSLVLFGMTGGAIDYARWFNLSTKTHAALDAAVLAGGRAAQVAEGDPAAAAVTAAREYFNTMKPSLLGSTEANFTVIEGNTVIRGVVSGALSTTLLKVVGIPSLPLAIQTEAVLAAGGNAETSLELSLMLDITGSMQGHKIDDMKDAAKDLVDIVVWADQTKFTSRIAIAPFAPRVNVGTLAGPVTGLPASKLVSGTRRYLKPCVTEREGTQAFTDAAPAMGAYVRAYMADNNVNTSGNYVNTGICTDPSADEQIVPLTNDKSALKGRIELLRANGSTAGQLGIAWAWYLISPKWTALLPEASAPAPYTLLKTTGPTSRNQLKKIAVLMTDGEFNTYGAINYGDGSAMSATVSANAVKICQNMKAAGIEVYTVGFDLGGNQQAINTLKACASRATLDPADVSSFFYNVTTGDELKGAFRDIALKIATLRLRK
jgi:Flp pilus assembly protein TadG